ncbi:MAG TPA: hypothetical protein VMR18_02475 [Candidatus Saccharimonadales bacterium]|jgi:hypothetical protein|nr:hypothetical protein [Candidatus Saccharimonadales bacterium]
MPTDTTTQPITLLKVIEKKNGRWWFRFSTILTTGQNRYYDWADICSPRSSLPANIRKLARAIWETPGVTDLYAQLGGKDGSRVGVKAEDMVRGDITYLRICDLFDDKV